MSVRTFKPGDPILKESAKLATEIRNVSRVTYFDDLSQLMELGAPLEESRREIFERGGHIALRKARRRARRFNQRSTNGGSMKKSGITNTRASLNASELLAEAVVTGTNATIERMEQRGQQELVGQGGESVSLPTDGSNHPAFATMGVIYGAPIQDDPIFRSATLPKGWKLEPTEHSMWSNLLDDKGRKRAQIFYKAAFYDRSCHIHLCRRFNVSMTFKTKASDSPTRNEVIDGSTGEVLHATEWRASNDYTSGDVDRKACAEFLAAKFPGYEDPAAYW